MSVTFTIEELAQGAVYYNYVMQPFPAEEAPSVSVFYKNDADEVFHTYSTCGRGVKVMMGAYKLAGSRAQGPRRGRRGLHDGMGASPRPLRPGAACGAGCPFVLLTHLKSERSDLANAS